MLEKILLLGNETVDTDNQANNLAELHNTKNYGLIEDPNYVPVNPGFYHTSTADLNEGQIANFSKYFDQIRLLDQPQSEYSNFKVLLRNFRLCQQLEKQGLTVVYRDNVNIQRHLKWVDYLKQNKSFCFSPFLTLVADSNYTQLCPKTSVPIKLPKDIVDWQSDSDYKVFRDKMIQGQSLQEKYCGLCYSRESQQIESTRQFETLEWAVRMQFDSPNDFASVKDPVHYEIRPSNKCNLMCRMCDDARSHLIEKESIELGIGLLDYRFEGLDFDKINFDTVQRIYVGGGEPTIMPEFYRFLEICIREKKTDFELCIGTNGMKISSKLRKLLQHFSDVMFSFSFDGYKAINDYIRWKSEFNTIVQNSRLLRLDGHKIGLQTVPSMYNITRLHEVFQFYDEEFPNSTSLVQAAAGKGNALLPWNHPRADLVVKSIDLCKKTAFYWTGGRNSKAYIDNFYNHYTSSEFKFDPYLLGRFFTYNDLLDKSRGSRLGDFIPELESCRSLAKFESNIFWLKSS